jgi:hypothetical protein
MRLHPSVLEAIALHPADRWGQISCLFMILGIRQHLVMTILKLGQLPRMFFVEFMVQFIDLSLCLIQGGFP